MRMKKGDCKSRLFACIQGVGLRFGPLRWAYAGPEPQVWLFHAHDYIGGLDDGERCGAFGDGGDGALELIASGYFHDSPFFVWCGPMLPALLSALRGGVAALLDGMQYACGKSSCEGVGRNTPLVVSFRHVSHNGPLSCVKEP